ncbi:hypothetical protein GcC1_074030 [Golovinomyces cichoracearum]|uniref:Uncharacterized protein n=1 Tax=Golovinomyces cichoracearum TaxID=62708 RepID=A0A420INL3_9PEZI|nr:hypothetical protein GcC1_074030 [Golovinomyces cichoracearum]
MTNTTDSGVTIRQIDLDIGHINLQLNAAQKKKLSLQSNTRRSILGFGGCVEGVQSLYMITR